MADGVPLWKKHLIARLREEKRTINNGNSAAPVTVSATDKQPAVPHLQSSPSGRAHNNIQTASVCTTRRPSKPCDNGKIVVNVDASSSRPPKTMVQERAWSVDYPSCESVNTVSENENNYYSSRDVTSDSDSSEDLHYGPGIVNKLKNKYLSLVLRGANDNGDATLKHQPNFRKAASLENILDSDADDDKRRVPATGCRYARRPGAPDVLKRARSVETISRPDVDGGLAVENKPRPVSLAGCDALITEGNDDTQQNDKIVCLKNRLFARRPLNRPSPPKRIAPLMNECEKPPPDFVKQAKMIFEKRPEQRTKAPASTGDVAAKIAGYKCIIIGQATKTSQQPPIGKKKPKILLPDKVVPAPKPQANGVKPPAPHPPQRDNDDVATKIKESIVKQREDEFPFPDLSIIENGAPRLSMSPYPSAISTPQTQKSDKEAPLKVAINGSSAVRRKLLSPPLRDRVAEKNLINVAKSLEKPNDSPRITKKSPPRESDTNSIVFKFTDRKDVPDYVQNDRSRVPAKLERPKVGEGGVILLPGASLGESFTDQDEDEEILKCLEAPPSPCNVTFINDNVLIDGRSSINQKTKKVRMQISFVESGPDVYEYPSESSMMIDETSTTSAADQIVPEDKEFPQNGKASDSFSAGHQVPILSGSSLANYTPKATEEFQPGVSRSLQSVPQPAKQDLPDDELEGLEEVDRPFSVGTNADILF